MFTCTLTLGSKASPELEGALLDQGFLTASAVSFLASYETFEAAEAACRLAAETLVAGGADLTRYEVSPGIDSASADVFALGV